MIHDSQHNEYGQNKIQVHSGSHPEGPTRGGGGPAGAGGECGRRVHDEQDSSPLRRRQNQHQDRGDPAEGKP